MMRSSTRGPSISPQRKPTATPRRTTGHTATWVQTTIDPIVDTHRTAIDMGTAATIDRALTCGIEAIATTATVRTDAAPTDIVRTDTDRTDIGRIDADTMVIEAAVATGASGSGMPVGLTAVPAVDSRFITVIKPPFILGLQSRLARAPSPG